MQIFAIICLVVIVITIQHLLNWGWRAASNVKYDKIGAEVFMCLGTLIGIVITLICGYHIIIWTYPLLNK